MELGISPGIHVMVDWSMALGQIGPPQKMGSCWMTAKQ